MNRGDEYLPADIGRSQLLFTFQRGLRNVDFFGFSKAQLIYKVVLGCRVSGECPPKHAGFILFFAAHFSMKASVYVCVFC
jgi:hypothetical protein